MACLSTSGRVVCGSRRQQAHKLLYQLFGSRPGYTAPSAATGLFSPPKVQQQAMRLYHGLSFSMGKDYPDLLVSSLSGEAYTARKVLC